MALFAFASLSLLVVFSIQVLAQKEDYYWQDYDGCIPTDAIVGGQDSNGTNIYIGQVYVRSKGLMVAQINVGDTEVYAAINGIQKVDSNIKILCGNQENFYWMESNCTVLHDMLENRTAVLGGHEDYEGDINIGRVEYEGETRIGKVNTFQLNGDSFFFFNNDGEEKLLKSYEIL
ncbi:DUF3421 domain containing protein, partial [Asbolus verrucosus]